MITGVTVGVPEDVDVGMSAVIETVESVKVDDVLVFESVDELPVVATISFRWVGTVAVTWVAVTEVG